MTAADWLSAPVVIEDATPDDAETLGDLHAASFNRAWGTAEFADLLRKPAVTALIARQGRRAGARRAVGFVLVSQAGDEAEILSFAVDPAHRRRGIGEKLLSAAIRRLYEARADHVFLEVDALNRKAAGLYDKLGFRRVAERRGYYGDATIGDGRALVLRCDLR